MARRLQILGSDVLRNTSREIDILTEMDFVGDLLRDMEAILDRHDGLGLAAPQAGENVRIFILNVTEPALKGNHIFINPVVETYGDMHKYEEGCLSIPDIYESFKRPESVLIRAFGKDGKQFEIDAGGLISRAIQHEYDHLEGVLFIDHLSTLKKHLLRKKISDIESESRKNGSVL